MWRKLFGKKNKSTIPANTQESVDVGPLRVVILSDLGNIRTNNEDMGLFFRNASEEVIREKGYLLIVADGMGGHQAGEVASNLAAETVSQLYFHGPDQSGIEKQLSKAFVAANEKIYGLSGSNAAYRGMGTTCTAVVVVNQAIYFAHAGDSRAYLVKDGIISQITEDHTYVQELVKSGEITAAEADTHPKRNILTNAMGTKPTLRVDSARYELAFEQDDRLLLCSDGLYDYLSAEEIRVMLERHSLQDAATSLVNEAKRRGGHDNITVVIAERVNLDAPGSGHETRDIQIPVTGNNPIPITTETLLP